MARPWLAALLVVLVGLASVRADDDDDPVIFQKSLSAWIQVLRNSEEQTVALATGAAGYQPIVMQKLVNRRRGALLALEAIGPVRSRHVIGTTAGALREDPSDRVREAAAQALGRMCVKAKEGKAKFEAGREALAVALRRDRSARVREVCAASLGRLEADAAPALPALIAALGDEHPGTRAAAADALRRLGKDATDALPDLQRTVRDRNADTLTRIQVALAIGRIGGADGVPALQEVLGDKTSAVDLRKATADALGLLGKNAAAATATLAAALAETGSAVELRRAAAAAIDQMGTEGRAALPALKKALKDDDRFVRCLAMHACAQLGKDLGGDTRDVVAVLLQGVNDGIGDVRLAAIEALGTLGPGTLGPDLPAVRERLTQASNDTQKAIREAALDSLKKLMPTP